MADVRRLISEHRDHRSVIRRYEAKAPHWLAAYALEVIFPKLVELELRISQECADYFREVPYSLAESIWLGGLRPACFVSFCCDCQYSVLYYPREPKVRTVSNLAFRRTDPVVLAVTLSPAEELR